MTEAPDTRPMNFVNPINFQKNLLGFDANCSATSIPDVTLTKIGLQTEVYDDSGGLDMANNQWVAPRDGVVLIIANLKMTGLGASDLELAVLVNKNDTEIASGGGSKSGNIGYVGVSICINVKKDDVIDIDVFQATGSTATLDTTSTVSGMLF